MAHILDSARSRFEALSTEKASSTKLQHHMANTDLLSGRSQIAGKTHTCHKWNYAVQVLMKQCITYASSMGQQLGFKTHPVGPESIIL